LWQSSPGTNRAVRSCRGCQRQEQAAGRTGCSWTGRGSTLPGLLVHQINTRRSCEGVKGGQRGPDAPSVSNCAAACDLLEPERRKGQLQGGGDWARVLQRVRVQGCARGQIRAGRKLGVCARGGRGKHGGDRGVRGNRIGSTAPRDTGSGGEGSREEGEGLRRSQGAARVRFRGADPDAEARPAGEKQRRGDRALEGRRKGRRRHVGPSWQRGRRKRGCDQELGRAGEGNRPGRGPRGRERGEGTRGEWAAGLRREKEREKRGGPVWPMRE
jgi:hypothetical protein